MSSRLRFRHLLILTHLTVFLLATVFMGWATFSLTKHFVDKKSFLTIPQISEKASAEENEKREFVVFEKREVVAARPNGNNRVKVLGFARDLNTFEDRIIYSFFDDPVDVRLQATTPSATILSNGKIFLHGVSDLKFAVLDTTGSNLSANYRFLASRDFPAAHVLFGKDEDYVYTTAPKTKENQRARIFWQHGKQKIQITSNSFPIENEFWLKPIGWSDEGENLYVERLSLHNAAAALWRISLKDKKVFPVSSISGTTHTNVKVCAEQNYAVFIQAPTDPTVGLFGQPVAPSRLIVTDLLTGSKETLLQSNELLEHLNVSCESRRIIVKEGNRMIHMDTAKKILPFPLLRGNILGISDSGNHVILRENNRFYIINISTGDRSEIGEKTRYTVIGLVTG